MIDGVKVMHRPRRLPDTRDGDRVGRPAVRQGKAPSAAEAIFGEDAGSSDALGQRLLTIEFHLDGSSLVADRITALLEAEANALQGP
jgi:hypothetical protein